MTPSIFPTGTVATWVSEFVSVLTANVAVIIGVLGFTAGLGLVISMLHSGTFPSSSDSTGGNFMSDSDADDFGDWYDVVKGDYNSEADALEDWKRNG